MERHGGIASEASSLEPMPPALPAEPLLRVTWTDPETGCRGYAVIDTLVNGIAGGGTRLRQGCSLEEVERLARAMTLKTAALGVPAGGSKCGVDCDPRDPRASAVLVRFVAALKPLFDSCLNTGEDMGTNQDLLAAVFAEAGAGHPLGAAFRRTADPQAAQERIRLGHLVTVDGIPLVDCVGGFGVSEAALAAMDHLGWEPRSTRAVVQGFGSMGGSSARFLSRAGVRVVGIADVRGTVANTQGLDVEWLLQHRNEHGEMDRSALPAGASEMERDAWLDLEAELLVPAALGDVIAADNAERVRARLLVEAANLPVTPEAEGRLRARGVPVVPDFVANAGTGGWIWWLILGMVEPTANAAFERISGSMRPAVRELFELASKGGTPLREAGLSGAAARLAEAQARSI
jgi:glutamate dehydrogenase (NAD(P)+)